MGRLDGKTCIVTGGAKGLGLVYVGALLAEGANVVATDIRGGVAAEAKRYNFAMLQIDPSDESWCDRVSACVGIPDRAD